MRKLLLTCLLMLLTWPLAEQRGAEPANNLESTALSAVRLVRDSADRWQRTGYRGAGVKVAILDSGFRGFREHLGHALPARVATRSFRFDGNLEARDSQHGILCGEVIHALAPEAELLFANWEPDNPRQFLEAVRWARKEGARIISCSVIMPGWSDGEGGGTIHEELARILGTGGDRGDVLFFACAGNIAQRHWSGAFQDDGQRFHQWQSGDTNNLVTPWGTERVTVELYGQPGTDYELSVRNTLTGREVGRALTRTQERRCQGSVRLEPEPGQTYQVRVRLVKGQPGRFHFVALGAHLRHSTPQGSIAFPADGPRVIAVGAVDENGRRFEYSSCGPNSPVLKPDLVAPVPFASQWRPRPFSGTSAAAPQAAAVAALLWSRHWSLTAQQVNSRLRTATRDLLTAGHDLETGYGLVLAPAE